MKSACIVFSAFALIVMSAAYVLAASVLPSSANATTGSSPSGVVTVTTAGNVGSNTSPQSVTGSSASDIGAPGKYTLTVSPSYTAGECFCKLTNPAGLDSHAIICNAQDSGKTEMLVTLEVQFPATLSSVYTVTWNNKNIAAKWQGQIILPATWANGSAKFQAFTREPYEAGQAAPTHVAVPVNGNGYWEHDKAAPANYQINDDSGQLDLVNQAHSFDVASTSANTTSGTLTHTCFTTLEVVLTQSVACEYNGTATFNVKTSSWDIYGWELDVSVTGP